MDTQTRRQISALGIDPDQPGITIGASLADRLRANRLPIPGGQQDLGDKPARKQAGRAKSHTEARYEEFLSGMLLAGKVQLWLPQPLLIRLTPDMTYRPDFLVILPDGRPCLVEVKGGRIWRHNVEKFKVARDWRPEYRWICLQWSKARWNVRYKTGKEPLELVP
jgi:hypothetical protein